MEEVISGEGVSWGKKEEEEAEVDMWSYIFGFVGLAVVRCAIELGIGEAMESEGRPMTVSELSSRLGCDRSLLSRIMRFLVSRKIFKPIRMPATTASNTELAYSETPLSRRLLKNMAAFVALESSPVMLAPWINLSARVLANGKPSFEKAHGEDVWSYAEGNREHSNLINEAMACDARLVMPTIIQAWRGWEGLRSVVDVGGGNGTAMRILVNACPWIRGINLDLPHVIAAAAPESGVEHVAGDMFHSVPKADAAFLMWVLHDWGDEECIQILSKCREAIPKENGRVIIAEAVIDDSEEGSTTSCDDELELKLKDVGLMLDMVMMAHTNIGKERTVKEWDYVIKGAGFSAYTLKPIQAVQSLIIAFP